LSRWFFGHAQDYGFPKRISSDNRQTLTVFERPTMIARNSPAITKIQY